MNTATTEIALSDLVAHWSPQPTEVSDVVSAKRAAQLADTLDVDHGVDEGEALPPLWHWANFVDWVPTRELGADGHPRDGRFLPPMPNRRRMFAGGRVEFMEALTIGELTVRRSTVLDKTVKRGRNGEMLFVTLRHEYHQRARLRVVEEQDVVYRSEVAAPASSPWVGAPLGEPTAPWGMTPELHPALLFRFSALTGNTHRIHYDQSYTTDVEGFPALVVHGPLLAIYMAELARANGGDISSFEFRLSRPVFVTDRIRVQGHPSDDHRTCRLEVMSGDDTVHATASATFRGPHRVDTQRRQGFDRI